MVHGCVYRQNPGAYEHMTLGGVVKLPHPDTVRESALRARILHLGECCALLMRSLTFCFSQLGRPLSGRNLFSKLDVLTQISIRYLLPWSF